MPPPSSMELVAATTAEEQHKPLPAKGQSGWFIRFVLGLYKSFDMDYTSVTGNIFAYIYQPEKRVKEIATRAYMDFLTENALDFTVFPSVLRIETEVVSMVLCHMQAPFGAAGSFSTGGTESIFLAMKAARDYAREKKGVQQPNIVVPETVHSAFYKAGHLLCIDVIVVPVDAVSRRVVAADVAAKVNSNTIMIVGSATAYPHGAADPIEDLGRLAEAKGLWLHVDACIGGWLLPYWRKLGVATVKFDFAEVPGVSSISVDLHKYAYCPKPASCVLYRSAELRSFQFFTFSDWPGYTMINPTFLSSKTGGPVAASWATLHAIGEKGYLDIMAQILDGTRQIVAGIKATPELRLTAEPDANLISFTSDTVHLFALCDIMKRKGWYIQAQLAYKDSPANVHISVTPQAARVAPRMIADLRGSIAEAKAYRAPANVGRAIEKAAGKDTMTRAEYLDLISEMGMSTTDAPDSLAEISSCLNALTPKLRNFLLLSFASDCFQFDNKVAEQQAALIMAEQVSAYKAKAAKAGAALLVLAGVGGAAYWYTSRR